MSELPPSHSDWQAVQGALFRLGQHLKNPTRLVLIGSAVGMFYGQPGRMTEDVDVWSPKSEVDLADLRQACEKAGLTFDPQGVDVSEVGLYIQMVKPGIVHVGKWRSEELMFRAGQLEVVHPPAAHVMASKLVRAEAHDIDDIVFLMQRLHVTLAEVREAAATFPAAVRERTEENIIFLELAQSAIDGAAAFLKDAQPEAPAPTPRRSRRP
jgi:hypothetical protein